jgi:hypothetical protein
MQQCEVDKRWFRTKQCPSKMKDNQSPSKMKNNQSPSKMKNNQSPSKMKDNQSPSKMKDSQSPSKMKNNQSPSKQDVSGRSGASAVACETLSLFERKPSELYSALAPPWDTQALAGLSVVSA